MPRKGETIFNQIIFDDICDRISEGESLRSICAEKEMPSKGAFLGWVNDNKALADQYARSISIRGELFGDEIIAISDDESIDINRAKLMADNRKWVASRMLPKRYGDKLVHEGNDEKPITIEKIIREVVVDCPKDKDA